MKDIKNILIGILLICTIIFGNKNFFTSDKLYKEKLKQIELANEKLKKERITIDLKINTLKIEYSKLKDHETKLNKEITNRDFEIAKNKATAARSQAELAKFKQDLIETQNKIKLLKDNPPNRTGEDLLNSLKIKTQK